MSWLIEVLSRETEKLTHLLAGRQFSRSNRNHMEEYKDCKDFIEQIQAAIEARKKKRAARR